MKILLSRFANGKRMTFTFHQANRPPMEKVKICENEPWGRVSADLFPPETSIKEALFSMDLYAKKRNEYGVGDFADWLKEKDGDTSELEKIITSPLQVEYQWWDPEKEDPNVFLDSAAALRFKMARKERCENA